MNALQARAATGTDTARAMEEGEASATRRECTRGGMRSIEVMPADDVSQSATDVTSMSLLAVELPVMSAMIEPRTKEVAPGCNTGIADAMDPNAT